MARHRHRLSAPVLIGVGAAFDFHAGDWCGQAPRWLQKRAEGWSGHLQDCHGTATVSEGVIYLTIRSFLALPRRQKIGFFATGGRKSTGSEEQTVSRAWRSAEGMDEPIAQRDYYRPRQYHGCDPKGELLADDGNTRPAPMVNNSNAYLRYFGHVSATKPSR